MTMFENSFYPRCYAIGVKTALLLLSITSMIGLESVDLSAGGIQELPSSDSTPEVVVVTCADTQHFSLVLSLIDSANRHQSHNLKEVAIYDLGLTEEEIELINLRPNVQIYSIEQANPYIFTHFDTRLERRRKPVRGWYSWKPVIIKQALEKFPYFLYMDCALTFKKPADPLFHYIKAAGYLFNSCDHTIEIMCTDRAKEIFQLVPDKGWVLKSDGIWAGCMGISNRVQESFVDPIYQLAKDIRNFEDDGTAPQGFGYARHDQLLFSILGVLQHMNISCRGNPLKVRIFGVPMTFVLDDYIYRKPGWWGDYYD